MFEVLFRNLVFGADMSAMGSHKVELLYIDKSRGKDIDLAPVESHIN